MFDFGWFSSGRDQAAIDLFTTALDRVRDGFIPGKMAFVFCDRAPDESLASDRFLAVVQERGVPLVTLSSRELRQKKGKEAETARKKFDTQVVNFLKVFSVQTVVFAGYMLIASPVLCDSFFCLNLHPALPGGSKGTWQEVIWQLMENNAKETGIMAHLATLKLDAGPVITYCRIPLTGSDFDPLWLDFRHKRNKKSLGEIRRKERETEPLFARIRQEGLRLEAPFLLLTLKSVAEGRLALGPRGPLIRSIAPRDGLDLTNRLKVFLKTI